MGSHVDAWGKSAICNASGDALNLEIARICYENRAEMKRDVEFVFWDGHEIAEGGGSKWYADNRTITVYPLFMRFLTDFNFPKNHF